MTLKKKKRLENRTFGLRQAYLPAFSFFIGFVYTLFPPHVVKLKLNVFWPVYRCQCQGGSRVHSPGGARSDGAWCHLSSAREILYKNLQPFLCLAVDLAHDATSVFY